MQVCHDTDNRSKTDARRMKWKLTAIPAATSMMSFSFGLRVRTYLAALAIGSFIFPNLSSFLSSKYMSHSSRFSLTPRAVEAVLEVWADIWCIQIKRIFMGWWREWSNAAVSDVQSSKKWRVKEQSPAYENGSARHRELAILGKCENPSMQTVRNDDFVRHEISNFDQQILQSKILVVFFRRYLAQSTLTAFAILLLQVNRKGSEAA